MTSLEPLTPSMFPPLSPQSCHLSSFPFSFPQVLTYPSPYPSCLERILNALPSDVLESLLVPTPQYLATEEPNTVTGLILSLIVVQGPQASTVDLLDSVLCL